MARLVVPLVLLLIVCAAAPPQPSPAGIELARLRKSIAERQEKLTEQLEKIQAELESIEAKSTAQHLALVKKYPDDPGVFPALEQLLLDATPHAGLALNLITKYHLDNARLGRLCLFLIEADETLGRRTEALLRGAWAKSPHRDVRGHAGLALARLLIARLETIESLDERTKYRKEAGELLENLSKRYAAVRLPSTGEDEEGQRLGAFTRPMLFELRRLAVGEIVPDLSGPDTEDKPLKLRDQRGKVTLLLFWSPASGASTELFPRMRLLLKKHTGRSFTIIGVVDDELEIPAELRPTWRSLRNQRSEGASISTEWNLRSWPMLYLIDHKGVIRRRWVSKPQPMVLEKAVEALLREAEGK